MIKKALLIIDVQKSSVIKEENAKAVEELQNKYDFVFVSQFMNKNSPCIKFLDDYEGYADETLAFVPIKKAHVFQKNIYSSFLPEMKDFKQIDICGCDTDACIYKTAMDLIENNIRPVILSAYCWSQSQELHECGMKLIKRNVGKINIK
ncbi:MAG: isochorismatase family protein [Lactobacillales bacterium]|jgi:nicotinamidase-related amidase|nr:isochorismatase family protein [Lactobacillales bacterium]